MSDFDDLIADLNEICEDVLADMEGTLTDGTVMLDPVAGFFEESFSDRLSSLYGFAEAAPTFECRESLIASLDRTKIPAGEWLYRPADRDRDYIVTKLLGPTKGMVLLVLSDA